MIPVGAIAEYCPACDLGNSRVIGVYAGAVHLRCVSCGREWSRRADEVRVRGNTVYPCPDIPGIVAQAYGRCQG